MGKGWVNIDIERLVTWALRDQGLGWSGGDSFSSAAQMAALGTIVDTSPSGSHPSIGLWSHDDALKVREAIDRLPARAAGLILRYGRAGLRPEFGAEGEGGWEQEIDAAGRPRWEWSDPINRTGERKPKMVYVGTLPEVIEAERAEWAVWREGLVALVDPLNMVLSEYIATAPAAPATPWLEAGKFVLGEGVEEVQRPRKVYEMEELPEALRERAQATVRTQASDWSIPPAPVVHKEESVPKKRTHGRS